MQKALTCLAAIGVTTLAIAQSPLTTTYANNNAGSVGGAVYFDLTVQTSVQITNIDVNSSSSGVTGTLDVYTISGGRAGQMASQAAWTGPSVLGSPITTTTPGTPSPCTLSAPLTLPAGVWGVALVAQGWAHAYTNGTGANQQYSTLELTLDAGNADNVPWSGGAFTPRVANVTITYAAGNPGTVFATQENYGDGCVMRYDSFYESMSAANFDLITPTDNMTLINAGTEYIALSGIASYVPPSLAATQLILADDAAVSVTLGQAMPYGLGQSTTTLEVCSNGFISTGSGNGTGYTPSVATMLDNIDTGWYSWHDYNPSTGVGLVTSEEVAGIHYITWDGIQSFGQSDSNTFQFQFDLASGNVSIVWVSISGLGNGHLIGCSLGGTSPDPGNSDLSVELPLSIAPAVAFSSLSVPLTMNADARPIINTTVNMIVDNMSATTLFGAVVVGINELPTPIDLGSLGMATCFQYTDQLFNVLFFPSGASSASVALTIPAMLSLNLHTQGFSYDPGGAPTAFGALASNATRLSTGDW